MPFLCSEYSGSVMLVFVSCPFFFAMFGLSVTALLPDGPFIVGFHCKEWVMVNSIVSLWSFPYDHLACETKGLSKYDCFHKRSNLWIPILHFYT
ncbi:hypothetical protein FKM82_011206 [Ascaphus truei]